MTPEAFDLHSVGIKHVLVPLDGSELALHAMPTARALARRFGADLQTINVVSSAQDVDRARHRAASALSVPIGDDRVFVVEGDLPSEKIVQRAESLGSCVVCLATHGRGRLRGAVVGSVARSVVQGIKDPVVVLGPMADNPGWTPRPSTWPEPLSVRRMVACVDGTEASEQVLPFAAAWARALGMSLTILTVIDDYLEPIGTQRRETRYGNHPDAGSYIEELVRDWREVGIGIDGEVLRDPIGLASGIRAYLDGRPAGLVALTTHARSGMQRVRLGAAAADIVHASVVPCLVAPVR